MINSIIPIGTEVKAGEQIYQILNFNKQGKLPTIVDVFASTDGLVYDISSNQAVNEGFVTVINILTNTH